MRLAASICSKAGPVLPMGKKMSGSGIPRQAASCRQSLSAAIAGSRKKVISFNRLRNGGGRGRRIFAT